MDLKIDISNANAITYCTEELGFTILGGIRMDGLDRLRVTIRIEVVNRKFEHYQNNAALAALPLNHNLDLYNDVQVEKLIRKAAERLEVGTPLSVEYIIHRPLLALDSCLTSVNKKIYFRWVVYQNIGSVSDYHFASKAIA